MKDKTNNQINVLNIFKKDGVWMFNDPDVGLFEEPFVSSMNPLIESIVFKDQFRAFISHSKMPDCSLILDKSEEYMEGTYKLRGTDLEGWLCPATLKYFKNYPSTIYIIIEHKMKNKTQDISRKDLAVIYKSEICKFWGWNPKEVERQKGLVSYKYVILDFSKQD